MRLTARAIIINNNTKEILLIKYLDLESESTRKYLNGFWVLPGGGLKKGEGFREALKREIYEETGLENVKILNCVMTRNIKSNIAGLDERNFYERYYIAQTHETNIKDGKLTPVEKNNIKEYKWWTPEEIKNTKEIVFPIKFVDYLDIVLSKPEHPIDITDINNI